MPGGAPVGVTVGVEADSVSVSDSAARAGVAVVDGDTRTTAVTTRTTAVTTRTMPTKTTIPTTGLIRTTRRR